MSNFSSLPKNPVRGLIESVITFEEEGDEGEGGALTLVSV